jgi:hypothetical protein
MKELNQFYKLQDKLIFDLEHRLLTYEQAAQRCEEVRNSIPDTIEPNVSPVRINYLMVEQFGKMLIFDGEKVFGITLTDDMPKDAMEDIKKNWIEQGKPKTTYRPSSFKPSTYTIDIDEN